MTLPIWSCLSLALKKHIALFLMSMVFIGAGALITYIAIAVVTPPAYIMLVLSVPFILCGVFLFATLPSSVLHYYETNVTRKFGHKTDAFLTHKEIYDILPIDEDEKPVLFMLTYQYAYKNCRDYKGSEIIDSHALYDALKIGNKIPITLQRHKPQKSAIRLRLFKQNYLT